VITAGNNVKAPALPQQKNQTIGNSAYILASFHDSPNSINSINQGITVKTANGGPIVAGTANHLILSSGSANVALKGALLYAQDTNGVRQGSFTDKGGANTFVPFPGCGKNPQGQISGVIQQTGVSATVSRWHHPYLHMEIKDCYTKLVNREPTAISSIMPQRPSHPVLLPLQAYQSRVKVLEPGNIRLM
jgi:hypothetical protein